MNTKTTLYLVVALAVLGSFYYVLQSRPAPAEKNALAAAASGASKAAVKLIDEPLGDIVKVTCRRKDAEAWVFQKDTSDSSASSVWRMTAPLKMKCTSWEVDQFGRQLGGIQYELSYKPGEPGAVTAAAAGLDPPEATVTLTDADGKTVAVEIGYAASNRETYVRLQGSDVICVAKANLTGLVKDKPLAYRDKQLWNFSKNDVRRVEIVDRSQASTPVTYTFERDASRWMMESPVTARATSKVDDMLTAMGTLRAMDWVDNDASKLAVYGLDPASWTIRATVEEKIEPEKKDQEDQTDETSKKEDKQADKEENAESKPTIKTTIYELDLSDRSPIGKETNVYLRVGGENAVGTLLKSTAEKFKPVMSQWRDMRITTVRAQDATQVELTTRQGAATLIKKGGSWSFEPDGGRAEDSVVNGLLKAIGDLTAVVFVDAEPIDPLQYGLNQPQATVRLTIPGVDHVEQITVGGYTEEQTKRLVYVRRNELSSVAKVRTSDVSTVVQAPTAYRDRGIVDVLPSRFEQLKLTTPNPFDGHPLSITLERNQSSWRMVAPVKADARQEQVDKLVEALGGLRAERVVADKGEASAYGLHAPSVTVALTYKPPVEYRISHKDGEKDKAEGKGGEDGKGKTAVPVEVQPPSKTLELLLTEHDGKFLAKRSDRPTIYEVTQPFYKQLLEEYRSDRVIHFDSAQVKSFSIRHGDKTFSFEKKEDHWVYATEPDLPLDSKKVENLLLQVRDLRTPRYVRYVKGDLARYGLSKPAHEVTVTYQDGHSDVLWVSAQSAGSGTEHGFYSVVKGRGDIFLLTPETVKRFAVSLDALE